MRRGSEPVIREAGVPVRVGEAENGRDIFDAILNLRHAFVDAGLQPPAVIELASFEEGMRLMQYVRPRYRDRFRRARYPHWTEDGPLTEVDISGMIVRWPAKRWAAGTREIIDL